MMAKITKGSAFAGAVKYIFDPKKQTELLAAEGVRLKDVESVARSFEAQRQLNTRVTRPVGHISLDFSAQDREQLDNAKMVAIAREYMERMGIRETQFIIGRHHDRAPPTSTCSTTVSTTMAAPSPTDTTVCGVPKFVGS